MIQKFFDWLTNQSEKTSSFQTDRYAPPAQENTFSNKPHVIPSLDIAEENISQLLQEHLSTVEDSTPSSQHLQEALSIATRSPSILSDSQKGSAILSLIGEEDALLLIRLMRWKNGITCPFCGSTNIKKLQGHAHQYKCQQCDGGDYHGAFDDLTGYFPKGDSHSARIWVLINYLKIFMPLSKISKLLGLSLEQTLRIMSMMQPSEMIDRKKKPIIPTLTKKET